MPHGVCVRSDGNGTIEFKELERALHGGGGEVASKLSQKRNGSRQRRVPRAASSFLILRRALVKHREELITILERLDDDDEGVCTPHDFRNAWRVVELDLSLTPPAPREELDSAFDDMDINGEGSIHIEEVSAALDGVGTQAARSRSQMERADATACWDPRRLLSCSPYHALACSPVLSLSLCAFQARSLSLSLTHTHYSHTHTHC